MAGIRFRVGGVQTYPLIEKSRPTQAPPARFPERINRIGQPSSTLPRKAPSQLGPEPGLECWDASGSIFGCRNSENLCPGLDIAFFRFRLKRTDSLRPDINPSLAYSPCR